MPGSKADKVFELTGEEGDGNENESDPEVEDMLGGEEEDDDRASQSAATYRGSLGKSSLKVSFSLSKVCTCRLCNKKSTDPSPLRGAHASDPYGGNLPWAKYKNVQAPAGEGGGEGGIFKVPAGRIDLVCLNVWRALGFGVSWHTG